MGRLINIKDLQGCAIIRPQKHSEFELIKQFSDIVSHDDIPTAYNVDKVVEQIKTHNYSDGIGWLALTEVTTIVKAGGVNG